ncbi:MAG: S-methyl-5'-thioadenosine phosphorylase [Proteobacteria bacterium]|nr:S-methyl-5'-thioadenosine phosphorylase [Pseudomonadota bacterium]MDA0951184.1 S-methyl-5'-thioadenosine phosphorylase [Pseudomonadota bacterium]MDA1070414.1 S-methyl-5'-thioadenosine phosphorylase [Pseudomonadota bacterium]
MPETVLGIIGGSGIYDIEGLQDARWQRVATPWGEPSDALLTGSLEGQRLVFLPRHGRGHPISPSGINARANIDALKRQGVTDIVSIGAVGSLKEELPPGTFVVVDQYIDRCHDRPKSFFGDGLVAHVSLARPTCNRMSEHVLAALGQTQIPHQRGGTYLAMEGPQFSTYAESLLYRSWGCSVIGMTAMPEARLAREAEICYAAVSMVTDFDCWHDDHDDVTVDAVIKVLLANAENARHLVGIIARRLSERPSACPAGCDHALDHALITAPDKRDPALVARLDAVAGRVLGNRA